MYFFILYSPLSLLLSVTTVRKNFSNGMIPSYWFIHTVFHSYQLFIVCFSRFSCSFFRAFLTTRVHACWYLHKSFSRRWLAREVCMGAFAWRISCQVLLYLLALCCRGCGSGLLTPLKYIFIHKPLFSVVLCFVLVTTLMETDFDHLLPSHV